MPKKISTLWRFLLPVLILLVVAPFILSQQQTSQQLGRIEEDASRRASVLAHLFNVTEELVGAQVDAAMRLLKERGSALGVPTISGTVHVDGRTVPNLMLGQFSQTNRFDLVDGITRTLGGTATLFVKSGDDFVRVATNVRQEDGTRAIGTVLDPHGKAIAAIRKGFPFHGVVDILGEPYITRYEPMHDAKGEIIGVWYVGYKVDMHVTRETIESYRYLQSGFAAVLDDKNTIRFLSSHISPARAVQDLQDTSTDWLKVSEPIPNWGYKVVIAYPRSEALSLGLANSMFVIIGGTLLGALIIAIILWQLRRLIIDPIGGDPALTIDIMQRIAAGDLESDGLQAKPGTLMANVLSMRRKLRETMVTLRQNAERMSLSASVFAHAHDGIFIADKSARIVDINPAFTKITGYERKDALDHFPWELGFASHDEAFFTRVWQEQQSSGEWRGETWNQRKNAEIYPAWLDLFLVRNEHGWATHYVGVFSDISLHKEQQQALERMAYHDALTQLPNRTLFADRLQQALARAQRSDEILAVCYFDLDGFKPINDSMGHEAGDQLLIQLAQRLRSSLRACDTVARLGGDEFALLLCDLGSADECLQTVTRLLDVISSPYMIKEQAISISASIGITISPFHDETPDTLLRHADQAMYQAKLAGKNRYHLFDVAHDREVRARHEALERIQQALELEEFCLYYQPKVDMRYGEVIGSEALIRWQHPQRGLVPPGEFLPLIEDTDFSIRLGEWVIRQALRQISAWQQIGLRLPVSVNITARHMMQSDFAARLADLLSEQPDVLPTLLELEITESAALEDIASVNSIIQECHLLGVTFALDDFGAGYSSLTYLRRIPADLLKIDQSFVRDMLQDPEDLTIVASVINLSRDFGRQVIAEGVETAEHGVKLLSMNCHLGQGYGIARPMPAEALPEWVESYRAPPAWTMAATPVPF